MKLRYYSILLVFVLLCCGFGFAVRASFEPFDLDDLMNYEISVNDSYTSKLDEMNGVTVPSDPAAIAGSSDLVVRARFDGSRQVSPDALYSDVEIEEVYKGDEAMAGQTICVVEAMNVVPTTKFLSSDRTYLPLQAGDEYLLLLKKVEFHPSRKLTDEQERQYYPTTQSQKSAYRITADRQTTLFDDPSVLQVPLRDTVGLDLAASSQYTLDAYYQAREVLFQTYGVEVS